MNVLHGTPCRLWHTTPYLEQQYTFAIVSRTGTTQGVEIGHFCFWLSAVGLVWRWRSSLLDWHARSVTQSLYLYFPLCGTSSDFLWNLSFGTYCDIRIFWKERMSVFVALINDGFRKHICLLTFDCYFMRHTIVLSQLYCSLLLFFCLGPIPVNR